MKFVWDKEKNEANIKKHMISFDQAQYAFLDENRIIALDIKHSTEKEKRYFCFGMFENIILTVRFTIRKNHIRIFGAGQWRQGRRIYEKNKNLPISTK